ncbi:MAG TPA: LysM peptidoglycan-binding domain-containing protein [Vicinamibacteria bacterium]
MGIFDYWKKGKARPEVPAVSPPKAAPVAPEPQADGDSSPLASASTYTYLVVKGDSLSTIASGQYGDAQKWRRIYDANRDLIDDPDILYAGQQLRIPE